jgi:2-polyprenyl-3-methyl-5-hydroxy-6-metoxy-1,4-benzoquinol methylase
VAYGEMLNENIELKDVYNAIYLNKDKVPGYATYSQLVNRALMTSNPLEFLSLESEQYFALKKFFVEQGDRDLKILEIGCGLGYTSLSLSKLGHNVVGLDISGESIDNAKRRFQHDKLTFICGDYRDFNFAEFDLIVSTELIEHLDSVSLGDFLRKIANEKSNYFITTPNRSFYSKRTIWKGDVPPVHFSWISEEAFKKWCEHNEKEIKFRDMSDFYKTRYLTNSVFQAYKFDPILSSNLEVIREDQFVEPVNKLTVTMKLKKFIKKISPFHNVADSKGEILAVVIYG